jgi:hypothetical protein
MICCNGECTRERNCPNRLFAVRAEAERSATQAAIVAKAHRQLSAIVAKEKAPQTVPPVEPKAEESTLWAPWTDWLLMLVAVVFCMTVVAGASFYFYNSLLA